MFGQNGNNNSSSSSADSSEFSEARLELEFVEISASDGGNVGSQISSCPKKMRGEIVEEKASPEEVCFRRF